MAPTNHGLIKAGDWVSGTSQIDEKFIGFVDEVQEDGFVKVWVTQCDREETVGTIVDAKLAKVKSLPDSAPSTPEELRSLIELALMTHDKAWFTELRAKLKEPAPAANGRTENLKGTDFLHSRQFGIVPHDPMGDEAA